MATLDNPERIHIGRALMAHATALGVTRGMLEAAAGPGIRQEIAWITAAQEPSVLRLHQFHFVLIEAYEACDNPATVAAPFREQWFTTEVDQLLHAQVLATGRRTSWWWSGYRSEEGAGAYCHHCTKLIHPYDLGRGVTQPVRLSVMQHRAWHAAEAIGSTTTKYGRKRA